MTIAKNIKKFRKLSNVSQSDLANKIGLTRNYLSLVESGKREPSMGTVKKISKLLKVPISILILETDNSSRNPIDKLLLKAYEMASRHSR